MRVKAIRDTKLFGEGSAGGKGAGLMQIAEYLLPKASRLATWILTTSFYDQYLESGRAVTKETRSALARILEELGEVPVGIRSSATNEASVAAGGAVSVHAGENASFMLPNSHPDPSVRLHQMERAICCIYEDFLHRQPEEGPEKMAIVVNPIPGVFDDTEAGPVYYPYVSGVANSYFPHALKTQDPKEGYARIAFGHGYATVLDDFPVIAMATIKNPLPLQLLNTGPGQTLFYALDMTRNRDLSGDELETMRRLHVRFASFHKIRLLGIRQGIITIEELVQNDRFGFRSALGEIMGEISRRIGSHFQIEFVFNIDFVSKSEDSGRFHVLQLTPLPELQHGVVSIPSRPRRTYLSTGNTQGHGIRKGIRHAVVVSPFTYAKENHDRVRERIREINRSMRTEGKAYLILVPGRLGSRNRDWGIDVDYKDVDNAVAIFEYGVDVAGRPEPVPEEQSMTGGIYGSHFLYMIQGGYNEDEKRLQTRMHGTQGTHFLTNLMSNNVIYAFLAPLEDTVDPWFFTCPEDGEPVTVLCFPAAVSVYADSVQQRCVVIDEEDEL